jgi:hypothetical protein
VTQTPRPPSFALHRPGDPSPVDDAVVVVPPLPQDARVSLDDDDAAAAVRGVLESLDEDLVGLAAVKTRMREIAALLMVERARSRFGLTTSKPSLHMSFTRARARPPWLFGWPRCCTRWAT